MAPRAPTGERPKIVGPEDGPEDPFPIFVSGPVIQGFGRGSKEVRLIFIQHPSIQVVIIRQETNDSGCSARHPYS